MSDQERGLSLPDLPANLSATALELSDIFYRVGEILEREARVALSGFSFSAGGLMLTGSITIRATAAVLRGDYQQVEPSWFEHTFEILADLAEKLHWKRSHFLSYGEALNGLLANQMEPEDETEPKTPDGGTPALCHRPERLTKSGAVLLSRNHIAILHGLFDRPDGVATSSRDLIRASCPYLSRFTSDPTNSYRIRDSLKTLHPLWVERNRRGRFVEWRLTERGRAILDLRIPAHVPGAGLYLGLAAYNGGGNDAA